MSAAQQTPTTTNADFDDLSPEERSAIEDGAAEDAERATLSRLAAQASEDDDGVDDDQEGAPTAAAEPAEATAPTATDSEPTAAKPATEPKEAPYLYALPDDFKDRKEALEAEEGDLARRFDDGDLDSKQYAVALRDLGARQSELSRMELKAELSQEMREQREQAAQEAAKTQWEDAVQRTVASSAKPENGGIDYKTDAGKAADLDMFVRRLGADDKNADRDMDWYLSEAHKRVLALHGMAAAAGKPAAPVQPPRKPPAAPVSLAHVPGSEGPGDVGSEFSDLDALDGDDLEDALNNLRRTNPARYEKFQRLAN